MGKKQEKQEIWIWSEGTTRGLLEYADSIEPIEKLLKKKLPYTESERKLLKKFIKHTYAGVCGYAIALGAAGFGVGCIGGLDDSRFSTLGGGLFGAEILLAAGSPIMLYLAYTPTHALIRLWKDRKIRRSHNLYEK